MSGLRMFTMSSSLVVGPSMWLGNMSKQSTQGLSEANWRVSTSVIKAPLSQGGNVSKLTAQTLSSLEVHKSTQFPLWRGIVSKRSEQKLFDICGRLECTHMMSWLSKAEAFLSMLHACVEALEVDTSKKQSVRSLSDSWVQQERAVSESVKPASVFSPTAETSTVLTVR